MTANELIGKAVSFQHPELPGMRIVGVVTEAKDNGRTVRGDIPDWMVTVRGGSGKTLTVSFVETYMKVSS